MIKSFPILLKTRNNRSILLSFPFKIDGNPTVNPASSHSTPFGPIGI